METNTGTSNTNMENNQSDMTHVKYGGAPIVFLQEKLLFGERKPTPSEWLKHTELYEAISKVIDSTHLTGLQRVNGFWRIYLDNIEDKITLMTKGVTLRGKNLCVLNTNPNRLDGEMTTKIKIKNVPLAVEDGVMERTLTLKGLDIISYSRMELRINGRLTNCETGDRIFIAKSSTLKDPFPRFMAFGNFTGRVIHDGQANQTKEITCKKCLEQGQMISECKNEWKCIDCKQFGHKIGQCQVTDDNEVPQSEPQSDSTQTDTPNTPVHGDDKQEDTQKQAKDEPKQARKKKKDKLINGQQCIDSFCTTETRKDTPNKNKPSRALERSPPTPAEQMNSRSKKNRQDPDSSDDSSGGSESDN